MANAVEVALLQIAQVIAMSDGSISDEEQTMLMELPQRIGLEADGMAQSSLIPSIAELATALTSHGDRCTAARIACLIAGVSRNPGDAQDINPDERSAYRDLITHLNLPEEELREIEWAARNELNQGKSLIQLIRDTLFSQGAWPEPGLMGPEIPGL